MIAIATGIDKLDKQIQHKLNESSKENKIINYREFFFKENFKVVILSKHLKGDISLEQLIFYLKSSNIRIIYLTEESNNEEIYLCFKYAVYDMIFDPITADTVLNKLDMPGNFSDYSKLFVEVMNGEKINSDKKAVLRQVMSKISPKDAPAASSAEENFELDRIKELRTKEKRQFEQDIAELKKKLQQEANKPAEIKVIEKTVKQQIVAFWTANNNFLKEKIMCNLALLLAHKSNQRIIILDLCKDSMVKLILKSEAVKQEEDKKNRNIEAEHNQIERIEQFENLHILTEEGRMDFEQKEAHMNLLDWLRENYDTIFINFGTDIDESSAIEAEIRRCTCFVAVLEGKLPIIKFTENKLEKLRSKISSEKIKLILADMNAYSFKEFRGVIDNEIISYINYNPKEDYYINGEKDFVLSQDIKKDLEGYNKILELLGYVPRIGVIKRILNKLY